MESSQLKRLKELEEENRRLKHVYAELSIDHRILKEVIEKNSKAQSKKSNSRRDSKRRRYQYR